GGGPHHLRGAGAGRARIRPPPRRGGRSHRPRGVRARHAAAHRALARAGGRSRENEVGGLVKLYGYFRSSAAYRTRIALNLKDLTYEMASVHLTRGGGQQHGPEYRAVNPQRRVPALALDNGETLIQSLAIIEYLDEVFPVPPLLPADPVARAHVRALAQVI